MIIETRKLPRNQWRADAAAYPQLPGRQGQTEAQAVANLLASLMCAAYRNEISPAELHGHLIGASSLITVKRLPKNG